DKVRRKPVLRLEPLPTLIEHAYKGDGAVADLSRKLGQRIVSEFRRRIDDLIEGEGCQATGLVQGHRLWHGGPPGDVSPGRAELITVRAAVDAGIGIVTRLT